LTIGICGAATQRPSLNRALDLRIAIPNFIVIIIRKDHILQLRRLPKYAPKPVASDLIPIYGLKVSLRLLGDLFYQF